MNDILPRVAVIVSVVLAISSVWLWKRDRKRAILILLAAVVVFLNAWLIGTMPSPPTAQP